MSFADDFATPDDLGPVRASELQGSLGSSLWAQGADALESGVGMLARIGAFDTAEHGDFSLAGQVGRLQARIASGMTPEQAATATAAESQSRQLAGSFAPTEVPIEAARGQLRAAGLDGQVKLPDQPTIKQPVLNLMIADGHERADRDAAVARGPHGFVSGALGYATSIGAGMIDPVNIAAFSVPVLGEARWGKILEGAGENLFARAGVRAAQGAVQGAAGTALLQPFDWRADTLDGRDYTFADALRNVGLGAAMGGGFHAGFGAIGDVAARMAGKRLAPPPEGTAAAESGAEAAPLEEEVPGITPSAAEAPAAAPADMAPHPGAVYGDLPPEARGDVLRSAAADVISGRPVRGAQMLQEAAKADPRIADAIEAWHGSPHDFEAFDLGAIGSGEGTQSFGHGLYFAENPAVAGTYRYARVDLPADVKVALDSVGRLGFGTRKEAMVAIRAHSDWADRWDVDPARSPEEAAAVETINRFVKSRSYSLYRVRIAADREHFLDWDKPLSEQSTRVKAALRRLGVPENSTLSGKDLLHELESRAVDLSPEEMEYREMLGHPIDASVRNPPGGSEILREAGIPGIKYLDQGSRGDWEIRENAKGYYVQQRLAQGVGGRVSDEYFRSRDAAQEWLDLNRTRNYVLFDDKLVNILEKNGEPVGEPDWQSLSDLAPAYDEPQAVAESRQADATPEPPSVEPAKAVSAAEQAAARAESILADLRPTLSEAERAQIDEVLQAMDRAREDRAAILEEGAACLAEAAA